MKATGGLLHSQLSATIARLGHGDEIVVADAGLPAPFDLLWIDLALRPGLVSFLDAVEAIATEMVVEGMMIATELSATRPETVESLGRIFPGIPIDTLAHEALKQRSTRAYAFVRTGEYTPYCNVILRAGVPFG